MNALKVSYRFVLMYRASNCFKREGKMGDKSVIYLPFCPRFHLETESGPAKEET